MNLIDPARIEQRARLLSGLNSDPRLRQACDLLAGALERGGQVLAFGNGGSATQSSHFAAELVNKFYCRRRALPAVSLSVDLAAVTAIANDEEYAAVFARQVEALGRPGDLLVAISTSGNSPNVLEAVEAAKALGLRTLGLLGRDGGRLRIACDDALVVPSPVTARIQEVHQMVYHFWCEALDALM